MSITMEECLGGQVNLKDEKSITGIGTSEFESAFERFFVENYPRVATVLVRLVGDRLRAEELATEAFWRYYCQPFARDSAGGFSIGSAGWLYRTATRLGIDSLRAETRRGRYEQQAADNADCSRQPDPLESVLRAEKQRHVRRALSALRPEQSQLLLLRASGFSYDELASVLGVKRGSVGTMLLRAEATFRKHYVRLFGNKEDL